MSEKITVLMVDDEAQFRFTTKKILDRKGFQTIMAASGEEAIEKLAEHPDVVVLDIKMPGMDGHEALRKIKETNPDLPVIMLTGHGGLPSAQESLSEGAFDYLAKPCDIDLLAGKIQDAVKFGKDPEAEEEKRVLGVMVPIKEYTTLPGTTTVEEAISELRSSFTLRASTSRIMETGHRSILIMDDANGIEGLLTIVDLLEMVLPSYLSAPKPSTADSIQYSPLFWRGMLRQAIREKKKVRIKEIMSPPPPTIDGLGNLMEAAHKMITENARRLAVVLSGETVGVLREQDLFFEMERILRLS